MDRADRNIYIRYVLKLLAEKYLVNQAAIAHNLGFTPKYVREFANEDRNLGNKNLDRIENLIFDLYKPILLDELPDSEDGVRNLIKFIKPKK